MSMSKTRMIARRALPMAFALLLASPLNMAAAQDAPLVENVSLPTIKSKTLDKQKFSFPDDMSGDPAIAIFVYTRDNQPDVDRLVALFDEAGQSGLEPTVWEFPVIKNPGFLLRGIINGGMRSGIDDSHRLAHTATLYVKSIEDFRAETQLMGEENVWVALIDKDGQVARATLSSSFETVEDIALFLAPPETSEAQ